MSIRVRATKRGFGGTPCRILEVGEVFTIPNEQALGSWMERLDPPAAEAPKPKAAAKQDVAK